MASCQVDNFDGILVVGVVWIPDKLHPNDVATFGVTLGLSFGLPYFLLMRTLPNDLVAVVAC